MSKYKAMFLPGHYYHVYNHAIADELLFKDSDNYYYFLRRLNHHLSDYVDLQAYCLLPKHYHLLIKVKRFSRDEIEVDRKVLHAFSNFQNSYTKAINKRNERKGRLVQSTICRKHVDKEMYLDNLVQYIRQNPVEHGFCSSPEKWRHLWISEELKAA